MSWQRSKNQALARMLRRFPSMATLWSRKMTADESAVPFASARVPLHKARVAVITTGGVHLRSDTPFDMSDEQGDPSWRAIPIDTAAEALTITHDYYDHRDADVDLNLVLPIERLAQWAQQGVIGALHATAYSFMGHIDGPHIETLRREKAPELAALLASQQVDYALLVPS